MRNRFMQWLTIGAFAVICASTAQAKAPATPLKTDAFLAACVADPNVVEEPGLEAGGKVTPKAYCDCLVAKYQDSKLSQTDVDMLTKVHKNDLTDAAAASYPTLEDLLGTNEGLEDACKKSLGLPVDSEEDEEAPPDEEALPPSEDAAPPE
jgi:hypothetical protein